jgi:predicted nucleotidyltransferase
MTDPTPPRAEASGAPSAAGAGPDPALLADLVRRIVEAVHPLRIILFGSAARGRMGPNSDLDVLVIVSDGTHTGRAEEAIYRNLWGLGFAADAIAVTQGDLQRFGSNPYLIYHDALTEGRELYHAAG